MNWSPGSLVAVDAGTLLAGIIRILKLFLPDSKDDEGFMTAGPFKGLHLPAQSAEANAAHIFREIIGAVLITHPHLDHISGLAINTPILEAGVDPNLLRLCHLSYLQSKTTCSTTLSGQICQMRMVVLGYSRTNDW